MVSSNGRLITFEGIEGCGKSTQVRLLDEELHLEGFKTCVTREPGGTPIGDQIRGVLLDPKFKEMSPMTELLLYAAGRAQHVAQVIRPAIEEGKIVLSDRYADSTTAYQGVARKIDLNKLFLIHKIATDDLKPDLTLLLDLPVEEGLKRIRTRRLDRLETEAVSFHERVRQAYLNLAEADPGRIKIIDAAGDIDTVHGAIKKEVLKVLK